MLKRGGNSVTNLPFGGIANPTQLLNWGYHGREAAENAMFYQLFFLLQIEEGLEM
jgi:hypothetical protein